MGLDRLKALDGSMMEGTQVHIPVEFTHLQVVYMFSLRVRIKMKVRPETDP
jgi:hypothetical protein